MKPSVSKLWRHPIKSHGREELKQVTLVEGRTMPWDRVWAVAHEASKTDGMAWAPCANFSRSSKAPQLQAINSVLDEERELVTLSHPNRPTITLHPERDSQQLMEWVKPLMPEERAQSARVVRVPNRGMTDTTFPSVSIGNFASNAAVSSLLGQDISPMRWRINLWLDDMKPWQEFELVGKTLAIGGAQFEVVEPIERCLATTANPLNGERDADTLGALQTLGHKNFGITARVSCGGKIKLGDTLETL